MHGAGISVSGGEGVIRQVALSWLWHPVEFLLRHCWLVKDWSHVTRQLSSHRGILVTLCHVIACRMCVAVWDTGFRTSVTL